MTDTPTPLGGYHTTPEPVTPRCEPPGDTLLPCPFCGDAAQFSLIRAPHVECTNCNATTAFSRDEAAAVAAWNERVPSPSDLAALVRAAKIGRDAMYAKGAGPGSRDFALEDEIAALDVVIAKFGKSAP